MSEAADRPTDRPHGWILRALLLLLLLSILSPLFENTKQQAAMAIADAQTADERTPRANFECVVGRPKLEARGDPTAGIV